MSIKHSVAVGLLASACAAVTLTGCGSSAPAKPAPPATVSPIAGSQVQRLQLTGHAIARLGITTQPVRRAPAGAGAREVIPYSAVVYDTDGSSWTYVNTAPRTYVRAPIAVVAIQGDNALLSAGPRLGAAVVTVGAAELLGTEYNISGEE
jgi:hypothetical protein